jgi:hypothetical protein
MESNIESWINPIKTVIENAYIVKNRYNTLNFALMLYAISLISKNRIRKITIKSPKRIKLKGVG